MRVLSRSVGCLILVLAAVAPSIGATTDAGEDAPNTDPVVIEVVEDPAPDAKPLLGPYCACYGTEPAMEYGGRGVSSLQGLTCGLLSRTAVAQRAPAVQLAWEIPMSLALFLVQHEVMGHGGRAREYDLDPSYGLGFDFSAYTTIGRDPQTTEQITLISGGGTEATGVMAHRLTLDMYRPGGGEGWQAPLLLLGKLDLPLYVSQTEKPRPPTGGDTDFEDQYIEGNDMANYLVSRQGQRVGADPIAVWNRTYSIDYDDRLLDDGYRELRAAAIWNLLDPAVISSFYAYIRGHIARGRTRITPPVWQVAEPLGLTAGTRAALGPDSVTRFLDVYFVTDYGVGTAYIRDLDSSIDRTYGAGLGFHSIDIGSRVTLGAQGDWWNTPESLERPAADDGWNLSVEVDGLIQRRWGLTAKLGAKSAGYFPGLPMDDGAYFGFGVLIRP